MQATANAVEGSAEFLSYAAGCFQQYLFIEMVGLFWIGAELAILFALSEARRFISQTPIPTQLALSSSFIRRASFYLAGFVGLGVALLAIHFYLAGENLAIRWQVHTLVWCSFIIAWVVLECLIVWQGYAIYSFLFKRLSRAPYGNLRVYLGIPSFIIFASILAAPLFYTLLQPHGGAHPPPIQECTQISDFEAMILPYRNGVHFLLRLAGVFWISVEWVAAIILVRAYFLFKQRVAI